MRVARQPPERGVLADVGQIALGSHRRHGPHAVKEQADGAPLYDGQFPDAAQVPTGEHNLACHVEAVVVALVLPSFSSTTSASPSKGALRWITEMGLARKLASSPACSSGAIRCSVALMQSHSWKLVQLQKLCLFVGSIGEDFRVQSRLEQALVDPLGRLAVAGAGLDAVEAAQIGDGLPGRITG